MPDGIFIGDGWPPLPQEFTLTGLYMHVVICAMLWYNYNCYVQPEFR